MCDVHLIPQKTETFIDIESRFECSFCEQMIFQCGIRVFGILDDGSPGTYIFYYHEQCHEDMQFETDETGCLNFGYPTFIENII